MRLNQVTIGSTDLGRAARFYTTLGLRLIVRDDHYLRFECPDGGSTFSIELVDAPLGPEHVTVYFESDHLDAEFGRLTGAGIAFDHAPTDMPWLWREARLHDPDGHHLCLFHAGANRRDPPWRVQEPVPGPGVRGPAPAPAVTLTAIGVVAGGRTEPIDDHWEGVEADIVLHDRFPPDALDGLEQFSHLDVVYVFHQVPEAAIVVGARHPRGREDWPLVGIFAQRAKARPNRIGVSTCRLLSVRGRTVRVADLDAIDGTPVLDIKPHMVEMGPRTAVTEPAWVKELMRQYWC